MTPIQRLLDTIAKVAADVNGNLDKLSQSVNIALGLPDNTIRFAYDAIKEDFVMRLSFDMSIQVGFSLWLKYV